MKAWLIAYGKTHLFYIILIVAGVVGFRTWLSEHDARVAAEQEVKQNQTLVKSLQQGIASRDAALTVATKTVQVVVHAAQTPTQVAAAVPVIAPELAPQLNVKPIDDKNVKVDSQGFINLLGNYEVLSKQEATCQSDLVDEKKIVTVDEQTIKDLKKKPKFWARIKSHGNWAVVGMLALEGARIYLTGKP